MLAEVKRWGNSLAVRLKKTDLDRLGVREGDTIRIMVQRIPTRGRVDLSGLPTFEDPDPHASENHDKHLYG